MYHQVIDKNPEEFKIRCLMDIRRCFEGRNILAEQPVAERKNPFFAGYGNRPNVRIEVFCDIAANVVIAGRTSLSCGWDSSVANLHHQPFRAAQTRAYSQLSNFVSLSTLFEKYVHGLSGNVWCSQILVPSKSNKRDLIVICSLP